MPSRTKQWEAKLEDLKAKDKQPKYAAQLLREIQTPKREWQPSYEELVRRSFGGNEIKKKADADPVQKKMKEENKEMRTVTLEPLEGIFGAHNYKNSCYLNSVMQCLAELKMKSRNSTIQKFLDCLRFGGVTEAIHRACAMAIDYVRPLYLTSTLGDPIETLQNMILSGLVDGSELEHWILYKECSRCKLGPKLVNQTIFVINKSDLSVQEALISGEECVCEERREVEGIIEPLRYLFVHKGNENPLSKNLFFNSQFFELRATICHNNLRYVNVLYRENECITVNNLDVTRDRTADARWYLAIYEKVRLVE
jgi:hypothetical protein